MYEFGYMEWNVFCSVSSICQIIWVDALLNHLQGTAFFWQSLWQNTEIFFIRTLAERKWHRHVVVSPSPGENGREHWEVFHKCTLFCPARLQYKSYLWLLTIQGIFPTFSLTSFHGVTAGAIQVRRGTIGPLGAPPGLQDRRSGHWTAGSSCLDEGWRSYLGGEL